MKPAISDDVMALINSKRETVTAAQLAPIIGTHASQIRAAAKDGTWDRCAYVIIGDHVKFFRVDFLKKGGWVE